MKPEICCHGRDQLSAAVSSQVVGAVVTAAWISCSRASWWPTSADTRQGIDEVGQRVAARLRVHPDVGCDAGQDVVAGEEEATTVLVEAQVPGRMAGSVHGTQIPSRQGQPVTVADEAVRFGLADVVGDLQRGPGQDPELVLGHSAVPQQCDHALQQVGDAGPVPGRQQRSVVGMQPHPGP